MTQRGFKPVKFVDEDFIKLPTRNDVGSAGYDFYSPCEVEIKPHETVKVETFVKAYMGQDEVLMIYPRSSMGIKHNITLANTTGVIDSSYYENPDNDGNIIIAFQNNGFETYKIKAGDKIAQGVFMKFLTCGDTPSGTRQGGIGSSGK